MLSSAFPRLRMNRMCPLCCGKPEAKCPRCRMTKRDYAKEGLDNEVEEMQYLKRTWEKCRKFKQVSTGIKKLDCIIELLFGKPHDRYWRDYSKATTKIEMSPFVCLRIARVAA